MVCHNDLSPKDTVCQLSGGELRPTAFIDWDLAAPGARIHDLAHVCWQYLGLGPSVTDIGEAARCMRLILDGYETWHPRTTRATVTTLSSDDTEAGCCGSHAPWPSG